MALSAVTSVLGKLGELAIQKAFELYGVSDQVELMRVELNLIQGILKDADRIDNKSNALLSWMNELSGLAIRIDNVMDTFLKEIEKDKSKGCRPISKLKFWKKPLHLNDLSAKIGRITPILKTLFERGTQLHITASDDTGTEGTARLPFRPTKPSDIDDSEVIGLDSDKHSILEHLLDQSISRRTVLSIVGVGGLGKTTLAHKVYKSSELEKRFHCRTWLSISQKFNEKKILREMLYSIKPTMKDKNPPLQYDELLTEVKSYLSDKRYLIILDDVWGVDLWEQLKKALPDANNGSRVLITTRFHNVAAAADRHTKPYELRFLTVDESVALLFRKAFQQFLRPENYPPTLKDVAQRLTQKCGGLPLALVVLGGILSTKEETFAAWNRVYETMNWHDEDGEKCMNILALSYRELSYLLRKCFLSFAAFPEDYVISAKHMARMWVAEDLMPKDIGTGSLEDRAEDCVQELVKRCLVQVTKKYANGYCKYCRMHDLVRDLAIHEAKKENFFTVFSREGDGDNIQQLQLPSNRVALQFCTPAADYGIHSTNTRSLLCFGKMISIHQEFTQLRVLVFERVDAHVDLSSLKNWVEGLVHLRYLGFRHCRELTFGSISLSGLKSLETLDCTGSRKINYWGNASSLWEIPTLRHAIIGFDADCPLNWDQLKNLQTIKWVRFMKDIPKLECNVNLRTLKVVWPEKEKVTVEEGWQRLQALLSRAVHLVSLCVLTKYIYIGRVPFLSIGTRGLPCHDKMQSLFLSGKWARDECVLSIEMLPKNLTKLKLALSGLEEDPMPVLERLQSLGILVLLRYSYSGRKMICSARGFPSLRKLQLAALENLSEWEIKEGAMPVLNHLEITDCPKLHTLPQLQNSASLQELIVTRASTQLHERSKTEDRHKIQQIPSVRITMEWA